MKVLVVDDTPDNVILVDLMLKNTEFSTVLSAGTAQEAYEILGLAGTGERIVKDIDIILMDIMLPGISGTEACQAIKLHSRLKDIPIIMVTAKTDVSSIEVAFEAGALDYMIKPIRKGDLISRLKFAKSFKQEVDRRHSLERERDSLKLEVQKFYNIQKNKGFICQECMKKYSSDSEAA